MTYRSKGSLVIPPKIDCRHKYSRLWGSLTVVFREVSDETNDYDLVLLLSDGFLKFTSLDRETDGRNIKGLEC